MSGKEARFVEELRRLQVRQATVERRFGQLCNGLEKRPGTSLPITAAAWSRSFSSSRSQLIRAASTAWTVVGT